jgi:hypothetical protein
LNFENELNRLSVRGIQLEMVSNGMAMGQAGMVLVGFFDFLINCLTKTNMDVLT